MVTCLCTGRLLIISYKSFNSLKGTVVKERDSLEMYVT